MSEVTEGEFKKQIHERIKAITKEFYEDWIEAEAVDDIVDEAKKEFPVKFTWQVMIGERKNGTCIFEEQVMPDAKLPENRANARMNKDEVTNWFLKWFGEQK